MNLIKCYHPPVNEIHLTNYILIPEEQVFEYTKDLYKLCLESIKQTVEDTEVKINEQVPKI